MKLVFCPECWDVIKMDYKKRTCKCGLSWGYYHEDGLHATYGGRCIPLGISNPSIAGAIQTDKCIENYEPERDPKSQGVRFEAFVIPSVAPTIHKENS